MPTHNYVKNRGRLRDILARIETHVKNFADLYLCYFFWYFICIDNLLRIIFDCLFWFVLLHIAPIMTFARSFLA